MKRIAVSLLMFVLLCTGAKAQHTFTHEQSSTYEWSTDTLVLKKLDRWRDLKFGVIFHWGLYAVPGIVESWALCSEDEDWISRYGHDNYQEFKDWYWNGLSKQFKPTKFDPAQWADAMKQAGMKYMIFTTKHHDGFCMFNSRYTDFSIAKCAFKGNPKADVAKYVFDAFRKEGFMTGAYFSKPDWHNQDYWWDYFATANRNVNYKIKRHPEKWEAFKTYTHNQIDELMSNYGGIDILWLDGGWVSPRNNQDIDMPKIAAAAREKQPGLLVVDRTIHGKYENYQTPEQTIPERQLPHPWESCVTLTTDWGWVKNPHYKSRNRIISMLMEVVAKGGNLLLGVGPTAEGLIEQPTMERLQEIGRWMQKNGKAIYNTHITPNYHSRNVWFTADKNGKTLYALYALAEGEKVPATIEWEGNVPDRGTSIRLLVTGQRVKWTAKDGKVTVSLPKKLAGSAEPLAFQFEMQSTK
ncbi:alpha-L-fucosidase [Bacteroides sp. KFT8]|uniref:alpha-L-fucosidase n=1 Tax=Bacteroides sp. KFT8 TaxID=2025659 RepID=UPI000C054DA9|nr:alpha-L-fucosidase [Bacteroides sp. KFT8]